ncbi:helix-turn-helix domain-containing protein [Nonomuraea sp. NPDC049709]|uniref:TetR/AcrR family transcriptional regulator n=1 Tax=Nonomuraea sp. NPDC049709 TaxID=3154736 RepID=UPI00342AE293
MRETSLELLMSRPVQERADAARNREKVLAAAARLFAEKGVDAVSMDAVAAEAGVGKGTLFRRFGDKSGLAVALLDSRERDLQQRILSGPPPLGPGAPARERLAAFVAAYLDYLFAHLDLVRMSETASPGARYRIGAYWFWHRHAAMLLAEARPAAGSATGPATGPAAGPGSDADLLSHVLLAAMGAEVAAMLKDDYGPDRAIRAVLTVATALTS